MFLYTEQLKYFENICEEKKDNNLDLGEIYQNLGTKLVIKFKNVEGWLDVDDHIEDLT